MSLTYFGVMSLPVTSKEMVVDYFERSNLSTKKAWNTLPVLKTLGNTTLTCTRKRDGYEITNIALTQGNRVEIHNEF